MFFFSIFQRACLLVLLLGSLSPLLANELDRPTIERINRQLERMLEDIEDAERSVYNKAKKDFATAMASSSRAVALYVSCYYEKRIKNKKSKPHEQFRAWKKSQKNKLHAKSFARILQIQLAWLVEAIQSTDYDAKQLSARARSCIKGTVGQYNDCKAYISELEKNVFQTDFARVYGITPIKNWPGNPLDVEGIYTQLVFPYYKEQKDVKGLRLIWGEYVELRGVLWRASSNKRYSDKWLKSQKTHFDWTLEKMCYELGDKQRAVKNMFNIIKKETDKDKKVSLILALQQLLSSEKKSTQ